MTDIINNVQNKLAAIEGVDAVLTATRVYINDSFKLEDFEQLIREHSDFLGAYAIHDDYIQFTHMHTSQ